MSKIPFDIYLLNRLGTIFFNSKLEILMLSMQVIFWPITFRDWNYWWQCCPLLFFPFYAYANKWVNCYSKWPVPVLWLLMNLWNTQLLSRHVHYSWQACTRLNLHLLRQSSLLSPWGCNSNFHCLWSNEVWMGRLHEMVGGWKKQWLAIVYN